jgi:hypothetical protein
MGGITEVGKCRLHTRMATHEMNESILSLTKAMDADFFVNLQ